MDGDQIISPRKISYAKPLQFKPKSPTEWPETSDYTPPGKSSLVKPFNFRSFETQNTELSESIVGSYNHKGGDKYFLVQELEYTVRRKFKVYSFLTWLYLVNFFNKIGLFLSNFPLDRDNRRLVILGNWPDKEPVVSEYLSLCHDLLVISH